MMYLPKPTTECATPNVSHDVNLCVPYVTNQSAPSSLIVADVPLWVGRSASLGGYASVVAQGNLCLISQFCCEPKIYSLKKEMSIKKNNAGLEIYFTMHKPQFGTLFRKNARDRHINF